MSDAARLISVPRLSLVVSAGLGLVISKKLAEAVSWRELQHTSLTLARAQMSDRLVAVQAAHMDVRVSWPFLSAFVFRRAAP